MITRSALLAFLILIANLSFGQETNWKSFPTKVKDTLPADYILADTMHAKPKATGSMAINVAPEILEANEAFKEASKISPQIKGYTILLFSGSGANSKQKARTMELGFNEKFPLVVTHLAWKSPNYEVRVGDFRTKLEAEKLLKEIRIDFPTAFVKSDMIELPNLYQEEEVTIDEGLEK